MKNFLRLVSILIFTTGGTYAQDPHLSQYFNNPVFYNPANAGFNIENIRVSANYRNQWSSSNPFKTEVIAVDKIVNHVGFGAILVKNSAGESSISRLSILGTISYRRTLDNDANHEIAGGLQVGVLQKSFNPSKMTFDNQYSYDTGFDPNLSSGETFANTKVTRPDLNFGIAYSYGISNPEIKIKPFAGISFAHINKPNESFIDVDNTNPLKTTYHGGVIIPIAKNLEVKPLVIISNQGDFNEVNYGVISSFSFPNTNIFQVGIFNRQHDAVVAYAGYRINKVQIGTSYDVTTSNLSSVNHGNGGFEISLIYTPQGKKVEKILKKEKPITPKQKKPVRKLTPPPFYSKAQRIDTPLQTEPVKTEAVAPAQPYVATTILPKEKIKPVAERKPVPEPIVAKKKAIVQTETPEVDFNSMSKLNHVLFSKNTIMYDINNRFDAIEATIDYMYKYPTSKLLLAGNADKAELAIKPTLGLLRAEAVKEYMVHKGIEESRIRTIDNKDKFPFGTGIEEFSNEKNRRVDIFLQK
jgi:type IX secretion system PorP/SprF family membrane protein